MSKIHSDNNKIPDIFIVSLSTCSPCNKTKRLFDSYDIEYEYVDMDKATEDEWEHALDQLDDFMSGGGLSRVYPIIIIKGRKMIQGFDDKMLNALAREMIMEKE